MKHKHWTESEKARLEFMATHNFRTKTIAAELDRTIDAVRSQASKENISLKPYDRK